MTNTTPSAEASHNTVVPSEVGWQFVPQYYTFVNKHPDRLHCFYTKSSTFIHGTEGEDGKPAFGQQEIHNKITSIGFEDCKVFIHSVDAQSSANGGIIIQVIGEMSNRGEPWRKFVQTFFLAEQPNGYFVLNDIFRFLKEETVESDEDGAGPSASESYSELPSVAPVEPSASPAPEPIPSKEDSAPSVEAVEEEPAPPYEPEPEAEPIVEKAAPTEINGHVEPAEKEPTPAPELPPTEPEQPAVAAPPTPVPESAAPSPAVAPSPAPPTPAAAPSPAPAPASPAPPPQAVAPQPAAPPVPKTWANLAAANSKKWGAAVAQESRGTSEVPAASSSNPPSGAQSPAGPGPAAGRISGGAHSAYQAAQNTPTAQCFVKSVQENVSDHALRQTLTTRFGPIKEIEIVRSKACAFLEFQSIDAARKAIIASLPVSQGGEGGIRVDIGDGQQMRISVETRKERGERPVSRPRGGVPVNGGDRGGFRGRGGPRGRGIGTK